MLWAYSHIKLIVAKTKSSLNSHKKDSEQQDFSLIISSYEVHSFLRVQQQYPAFK